MDKEKLQNITAVLYTYSAADFKDRLLERITITDLMDLVIKSNDEKAEFRAAWALEHILLSNRDLLTNHNKDILYVYNNTQNWSVLRSTTKIIMELLKNPLRYIFYNDEEVTGIIIDKTFKILDDTNCPIAVRCNAYDILFRMGIDQKWVLNDLKTQIYFDMEKSPSPALISRAKRILKKLERYP